ncbi:MAG: cyclic nucleotide-binding domain-containing protein [Proteobacteria bacterium]|nr:cyclic nucleotide-binding domain-containing protein [Pseudomonadota bacterium]
MTDVAMMARPQRWDVPFDPAMTDADVRLLLQRREFRDIKPDNFPPHMPLEGILKNDARLVHFRPGDIVVREGDYGNSAFLVLEGRLRVVLAPGLPPDLHGRQHGRQKGFFEALAQLWTNRRIPEVRDIRRYRFAREGLRHDYSSGNVRVFIQDIPAVLDKHRTAGLEDGAIFGEIAALGRVPRTASIFAETDARLLEIRWQGLRELRRYDENWRRQIDERYRANALRTHLRDTKIFEGLDENVLEAIAERTLFETYGSFDWHLSYKQLMQRGENAEAKEPVIAQQGDYPDGVLLIRAGFARVSMKLGTGKRTLTYLGAGDHYGFDELYANWKSGETKPLQTTLTAVGYIDILRVPAEVLEKHVFPRQAQPPKALISLADRPLSDDALIDWAVDKRFINATKAMLIDLDRCVRCDDCVRACASTHGGNPRFVRAGSTFDHWMVTNACMHCADPVCMIGCPTGAIHRSLEGGTVVINDDTCIGCGTCAASCPYDNIRMVEITDVSGKELVDPKTRQPILKATKCDLCESNPGGPACVRACPHDALRRVDFRDTNPFRSPNA